MEPKGNKLQFSIKNPSFCREYKKKATFERCFLEKQAFFGVVGFIQVVAATFSG
jgi:hypothetical protein